MDISEFQKNTVPGAKKSVLDPHLKEIRQLKNTGYSNKQIKDWLDLNGIKVSQEAVRKFIKSREGVEAKSSSHPPLFTQQDSAAVTQTDNQKGREGGKEAEIDFTALAAGLKTERTENGFMKMPGEPEVQTGKAGKKTN